MKTIKEQIDIIVGATALHFDVQAKKIKEKGRSGRVVMARHMAIALVKRSVKPTLTLKEIGHHFGKRDHSTVINSCKKADDLYQWDSKFRQTTHDVITRIQLMIDTRQQYCNPVRFYKLAPCVSL